MFGRHLYDFKPPAEDAKIRGQILWHNCFIHSSVVVRKSLLLQVGGYRERDKHVEDYAPWLRPGQVAKLVNLPAIMLR